MQGEGLVLCAGLRDGEGEDRLDRAGNDPRIDLFSVCLRALCETSRLKGERAPAALYMKYTHTPGGVFRVNNSCTSAQPDVVHSEVSQFTHTCAD
ncbi:unnamed protein product [Onchocerca flexuosa]|uniref:Uncharacterized protein n=1 Tax=Onchocerca flexuosa TaxID=387005 RepID=A0A183HYX0_9BILA|nr:unnamed protein product [Onchocerca flexuosa]